mmetsp:Transcript_156270/g.501392  ORF Transcript_156270/g.501392 Transcript_156270/m.501392 type:complete len:215 (-) Transcript_156270:2186-2830(-)
MLPPAASCPARSPAPAALAPPGMRRQRRRCRPGCAGMCGGTRCRRSGPRSTCDGRGVCARPSTRGFKSRAVGGRLAPTFRSRRGRTRAQTLHSRLTQTPLPPWSSLTIGQRICGGPRSWTGVQPIGRRGNTSRGGKNMGSTVCDRGRRGGASSSCPWTCSSLERVTAAGRAVAGRFRRTLHPRTRTRPQAKNRNGSTQSSTAMMAPCPTQGTAA